MTTTVVYDWNGTLLDDIDISFECFRITMDMLGAKTPTVEEYIEFYDIPIGNLYVAAGVPREVFVERRDEIYHAFFSNYAERAHKAKIRLHAPDTLLSIQNGGAKQIIVSNDLSEQISHQLDRLNIKPFISEVLAFSNMESRKVPKGELLQQYMKKEGAPAHKTVIVGDVVEEISIARDLGLVSVAITGGYVSEARLRAAGPDHLIHSLAELEPILVERGLIGVGGGK